MTSIASLYTKNLLLELAARERRTTLFRKSCARKVGALARADYFREEADAYEQEMIARVGVKSTAGVYERC
jgi:hypothetical protein